jgi:hypothetical protein
MEGERPWSGVCVGLLWGREAERLKANGNHGGLCAALVLAEKFNKGGGRLLLKKKKIKFFRVRIFLLFFVVKNAPPA